MAKKIEWFFVTILNAGKIILRRLKITKRKSVPEMNSVSDSECTEDYYPEFTTDKIREERLSSLISQMSYSTATLSELGIRYSLDTVYTLIDDQSSVQATLENLYNEKIERENSRYHESIADTSRLFELAV